MSIVGVSFRVTVRVTNSPALLQIKRLLSSRRLFGREGGSSFVESVFALMCRPCTTIFSVPFFFCAMAFMWSTTTMPTGFRLDGRTATLSNRRDPLCICSARSMLLSLVDVHTHTDAAKCAMHTRCVGFLRIPWRGSSTVQRKKNVVGMFVCFYSRVRRPMPTQEKPSAEKHLEFLFALI